MRRSIVAVAAVLLLVGCGGSDEPTTPETSSTPSATTTTSALPDPSKLVVRPGRVGDVTAGLDKTKAIATGVFDADVEGVEGCTFQLQWKKPYVGLDVLTDEQGTITSLGVTEGGPKTSAGVGVGSTLAEIQAAYPDVSAPAELGFGQAGVIHTLGEDHIGFLFGDTTVASIKPVSKVTFMEVTSGDEPELMRSGC